jgi:septin family protein
MKEISSWCNLIPIISKGDSLNQEEAIKLKEDVILNAGTYNIEFFELNDAINVLFKFILHFINRKYVKTKDQQTVS